MLKFIRAGIVPRYRMGGGASVPVGIAAAARGSPAIDHYPNLVVGNVPEAAARWKLRWDGSTCGLPALIGPR